MDCQEFNTSSSCDLFRLIHHSVSSSFKICHDICSKHNIKIFECYYKQKKQYIQTKYLVLENTSNSY